MDVSGDAVARCVLRTFDLLPKKFKPRTYEDGTREWVPLCGIVTGHSSTEVNNQSKVGSAESSTTSLHCVALGTGMRCLPAAKVPLAKGRCLHDWHAEIVAIRAFNLFLLQECTKLGNPNTSSSFVRQVLYGDSPSSQAQPFAVKEGIKVYMYCSEVPCGDASMEFVMSLQDDATPWKVTPSAGGDLALQGRGHFSKLGIVRRKPARGDAPETLSKSCSDKLSMKQCTSLLSSVTNVLIHPGNAYIHTLILPADQHVQTATSRAFSVEGRMAQLATSRDTLHAWPGGYSYNPFRILTTSEHFDYSRQKTKHQTKSLGSNITALWTPDCQEVLVGGTIQGCKQFSERGSSAISKAKMWELAVSVGRSRCVPFVKNNLEQALYSEVKASPLLDHRRRVKDDVREKALYNWMRNERGDDFARAADAGTIQGRRHDFTG